MTSDQNATAPDTDHRPAVTAAKHPSDTQKRRWLGLLDRLDEVRDLGSAVGVDVGVDVTAADRLLGSTHPRLVLLGPSGAGKSSTVKALLGRAEVTPVAGSGAATSVVITVRAVEKPEDEGVEITYLTAAAYRDRLDRLAKGIVELPATLDTAAVRTVLDDLKAWSAGREASADVRRAEILAQCLRARQHAGGRIVDGEPDVRRFALDDRTWHGLVVDPIDARKADAAALETRLVASATVRVVPGPDAGVLSGLDVVDIPGTDGGVLLHGQVADEEIRRDDAMVLMMLGKAKQRLNTTGAHDILDRAATDFLSTLSEADRDAAAGKFFVVVNDDGLEKVRTKEWGRVEAAASQAMDALSPGYARRYGTRAPGRPYFVVRPLACLATESPAVVGADPDVSATDYERSVGYALVWLGHPDDTTSRQDRRLQEAVRAHSEIPALRDALARFLREDRVDGQLTAARVHLTRAVGAMATAVATRLEALGIDPSARVDPENLDRVAGDRELNTAADEIRTAIGDAMEQGQKGSTVLDDTTSSRALSTAQAVCDLVGEVVARWWEDLPDPVHRQDGPDERLRRAAMDLDRELIRAYRAVGLDLADGHIARVAALLDADVLPALRRRQDALPQANRRADLDTAYAGAVAAFAADYRAAVAAAVVHELDRDVASSMIVAFITAERSAHPPQNREEWTAHLGGVVAKLAEDVIGRAELAHGLPAQFIVAGDALEAALSALADDMAARWRESFYSGQHPEFRDAVLARGAGRHADVRALLALRDRIEALRERLRDEATS